jgi:HlyD family type I secretion membrane fusion protein
MATTPGQTSVMATTPRQTSDDPRVFALIGYAIIIFSFAVLGGWAALAPLGSAVVASGFVNTEGNKKTVQHLEGGIVKEILIREGDHVAAGQILMRLDETQPKANAEIARNQLYAAVARDARLAAELDGSTEVQFPDELTSVVGDPIVLKAMDDQRSQFKERRATLDGQISILQSKGDQLRQEIEGIDRQRAGNEEQVRFIKDELEGVRGLYDKSLVPKTRWLALERERARLEGEIGRAIAEHAKAEKSMGETELQIQQAKQQFQEQSSRDLVETREKLRDLRSKFVVAEDVLRRLEVVAPVTGRVQNLKVFTIRAVIRQGEPLLEIGPDQDKLIVQAHISTLDIEGVFVGNTAEVRFPAFHDRALPMIGGKIISISQDRLMDEASKQPYYLALIDVPEENIPQQYRGRLSSGMNAEVIMPTRERTALDYLIEPLRNRMRTAFRER